MPVGCHEQSVKQTSTSGVHLVANFSHIMKTVQIQAIHVKALHCDEAKVDFVEYEMPGLQLLFMNE
jgi:hypothetical protein